MVLVASKALEYAEVTLGVHTVYEEARTAHNGLDECLTRLSEARDNKRLLEYNLADREQEIIQQCWIDNPDMAQGKMDKFAKVQIHADAGWKAIRSQLAETLSEIDGLECDKTTLETGIKIAVSRLHELGGYLAYLAAVKQAASTNTTENPGVTA